MKPLAQNNEQVCSLVAEVIGPIVPIKPYVGFRSLTPSVMMNRSLSGAVGIEPSPAAETLLFRDCMLVAKSVLWERPDAVRGGVMA